MVVIFEPDKSIATSKLIAPTGMPTGEIWYKTRLRGILKLLRQDGWKQVRMKGSHRQFRYPRKPGTVAVSGKPGVDMTMGTLKNIFKQARLKYD